MSPKPTSSDRELVFQTLEGDIQAYGLLVEKYQDKLYRFALRLSNNKEDAQDLTQDAFIRGYKYLHNFSPGYSFSSWIYAITHNLWIDRAKKQYQRKTVPLDESGPDEEPLINRVESPIPGPEEQALENISEEETRDLIRQLPPLYRGILIMRFIELLSYDEIGRILNIPSGTVKTRIFRARNMIKQLYFEKLGDFNKD